MSIFQIGVNQGLSSFDATQRLMDNLTQQMATGNKINSSSDDPVIWARSQQDTIAFKGLQTTNDGLAVIATSIRNADTAMGTMNTNIEQMKASLDAIIKNYPPFPPGSQDRIKYLEMFNSLKLQIDQLSAPEDDKGAKQIMADSTTTPGDWTIPINDKGLSVTVHKQDVSTGIAGLDIPALSETASDADIAAARASLDNAQTTLNARQAALGTDAAAITRSQDYNTSISQVQQTDGETWTLADMNEVSANYKSVELKNALALQAVTNLTTMQTQLFDVLK